MRTDFDFRSLDRTYIVAEIGVNHEGSKEVAADMIRKAAASGPDAVKFQTYIPERFVSRVESDRLARARRFALSQSDFRELAGIAAASGLTFFSTPLDPESADFLDEIAPMFKIGSGDLTYVDLIRHLASKGKPVIISTGTGTRGEIQTAIDAAVAGYPEIVSNGHLLLMHCVTAYPVPDDDANLANIRWLKSEFGLPVGYSDHTLGIKACELAVAVGAAAIEKHFTYRKEDQEFHDHVLSADPADMHELVQAIRRAEVYLGRAERRRSPAEEKMLLLVRRSVAALVDIPAGTPVRAEWLTCLRPASGVDAREVGRVVGSRLARDVPAGDLIYERDLDG